LVCKIPKIETRDPFHSVRVRVYKNKKMTLKNFCSAISTALKIPINIMTTAEVSLQCFFDEKKTTSVFYPFPFFFTLSDVIEFSRRKIQGVSTQL